MKTLISSLILFVTFSTINTFSQETDSPKRSKQKSKSERNTEISQPTCDIKDEVDDFTETRKIEVQPKYIGEGEYGKRLVTGITIINDKVLLRTELYSSSSICFNSKSKTMIKLANDSIITLSYIGDIECSSYLLGFFIIPDDILELLLLNDIIKIRVYTTEGYIDYLVQDKWPVVNRTTPAVNPQQYIKFSLTCAMDQLKKKPISNSSF